MTIVVSDQDGRIFVFTKGADSVLSKKVTINPLLVEKTNDHLLKFAKSGLRTLMFVYKELTTEELAEWQKMYSVTLLFKIGSPY